MYGHSGDDYIVATISKSCLTTTDKIEINKTILTYLINEKR